MDDGTWNDWPAITDIAMPKGDGQNPEGRNSLKQALRRAVNEAVATGRCDPDEAFGVLMFVASSYVAKIEDAAARNKYVEQIADNFGMMVDLLRAGDDRLTEAMAEAVDATRQ